MVRGQLYGRSWADLSVRVDPPSADVELITGTGRRSGGVLFRYLNPGEVRIEARAPGFRTTARIIHLSPGQHTQVEIDLIAERSAELRIRSYPQGALLFAGSEKMGRTPLRIEEAVLPQYLTLRREGYHEKNVLVRDDPEGAVLEYRLHPGEVDIEGVVRNARDRFYFGLAGFFLTIPLTMYSYGMSTDYAFTYSSAVGATAEERQRLHELSQLWYTAYLGSLFLNGTFLVDSVLQMVNYIDTAQAQ